MYRYALILLMITSTISLYGKIVNGYEPGLVNKQEALSTLRFVLSNDNTLSSIQRYTIKSEIKAIIDYLAWYELTEELINQLKVISPTIYHNSASIVDKKGRTTDIYVKVIPREKAKVQLIAASFLHQQPHDVDMSVSEYGECTASIEIWISDNCLFHLSHELGHVNYIIPNLASYCVFYKNAYSQDSRPSYIGHNFFDLSGRQAQAFGKEFVRNRKRYIQQHGEKPESLFALINPLRRSIRDSAEHDIQFVKRSKEVPYPSLSNWPK